MTIGRTDMEPLEEFKQFLIDNNCLESYLYNLKHFKFSNVSTTLFYKFILYAFKWNATKEGWNFWNALGCKWKTRIRDCNQDNYYTFTEVNEYLSTNTESLWTD